MKKRKNAFTLLEILIALVLAGFLFAFIFNSYRQMMVANIKLEKAKQEVLSNKMIQQRLNELLARLELQKTGDEPPFYTDILPDSKGPALIFSCDNGIDPNPAFCGPVKIELFLNHKNELCLNTIGSGEAVRKEVLKENIQELSFRFFDWDIEKKGVPPIVEISLKPQLEFAFFLPAANREIVYK